MSRVSALKEARVTALKAASEVNDYGTCCLDFPYFWVPKVRAATVQAAGEEAGVRIEVGNYHGRIFMPEMPADS